MLTRRDFFGAAAGTLVAGSTQAKGDDVSCPFPDGDCVCGGCGSDDGQNDEWEARYCEWYMNYKPELELGHSARWKIQRYPGAKWVPIHRFDGEDANSIFDSWCQDIISDWDTIEPVMTNCVMEAVG